MTLRLSLIAGAVAAFVLVGAYAYHKDREARQARSERDAAVLQSKVDTGAAAIADRVNTVRVEIHKQTEEKAREVEAIPSDDLPADVRERWLAGLRYSGQRPNPDGRGELPATMPGAEP